MENLYSFVIDTSFVNVASNSNYTSYTFYISRANQNNEEFENLLIEVKNNDLPKAYLLKYKLNLDNNYSLLSKNEIEYNLNEQGLTYYGQECQTETMVVSVSCSGAGHHYDNSNGDCSAGDFYSITLSREVCSGGVGEMGGDEGGGFTSTTTSTTIGSGATSQTSYTYTMPPLEVKRKTFLMDLKNNNLAAYNWLRTQSEDTQGQIYNYLASTGTMSNPEQSYSQEKCDHIEQMASLCALNNSTFTFANNLNATNSLSFNNFYELQNYLNSTEGNQTLNVSQTPNQQNNYIGIYKFRIRSFGGVEVNIKFTSSNGIYTVENLTSNDYGLTMFDEWEQTDFVTNNMNGLIKINIIGIVKSKYNIEGLGFNFNQKYSLTLIIDPVTSAVEASIWKKI